MRHLLKGVSDLFSFYPTSLTTSSLIWTGIDATRSLLKKYASVNSWNDSFISDILDEIYGSYAIKNGRVHFN